MAKILSLKLQEKVLQESEEILRQRKTSRNAYFNEAIHFYNKLWKRKLLKKALREESALVSADSLEVLEAFEQLHGGSNSRDQQSAVHRATGRNCPFESGMTY